MKNIVLLLAMSLLISCDKVYSPGVIIATHIDMAAIMIKYNMKKAMGFDPGGSSTLVVDNETLNISPYNKDYEENIYALSPQARAVANAVLIYETE